MYQHSFLFAYHSSAFEFDLVKSITKQFYYKRDIFVKTKRKKNRDIKAWLRRPIPKMNKIKILQMIAINQGKQYLPKETTNIKKKDKEEEEEDGNQMEMLSN